MLLIASLFIYLSVLIKWIIIEFFNLINKLKSKSECNVMYVKIKLNEFNKYLWDWSLTKRNKTKLN